MTIFYILRDTSNSFSGDVFLVGCTNVGKSSLFNILLQSDYCKVQATDLVQRATTSPWPGTTLNLLKFPIMRIQQKKLILRVERLAEANKKAAREEQFRKEQLRATKKAAYATLIGHIGQSFSLPANSIREASDPFSSANNAKARNVGGIGLDENMYPLSKWCYDTPGVVQPDQVRQMSRNDKY